MINQSEQNLLDPFGAGGDYARLFQSGSVSQDEMLKALTAGIPGTAPGTLDAAMPEDLSPLVTSITFTDKHMRFQKALAKAKATNTLHQYTRLTAHGHDLDGFTAEGGIPQVESTPEWARLSEKLRQVVELFRVTDIARTVQILPGVGADALQANRRAAAINMMKKIEMGLFFADSALNPYAFDGLIPQILSDAPADAIIDLRGANLTPDEIDQRAADVANRFGSLDAVWMSVGAKRILAQLQSPYVRLARAETPGNKGPSVQGSPVDGLAASTSEFVKYESNVFLHPLRNQIVAAGVGSSKPLVPVLTSATPAADAASLFVAGDAGVYYYKIVARGEYGESTPLTVGPITVAAGEKVPIVLNDAAVSNVWYYRVYRSPKGGAASDANRWMVDVAKAGAGATTITDLNGNIPGCSYAIGLSYDPEVLQVVNLGAEMAEVQLAKLDTSERRALVRVMALLLRAPSKLVLWKNVAETLA